MFNDNRVNAFPIVLRTKQGCLFSPLLFNIILAILISAIWQEKNTTKVIQIEIEEIKLSLFANDMTVYVENSKESTTKKTTSRTT